MMYVINYYYPFGYPLWYIYWLANL